MRTELVVIVRRRERARGIDLEKDAPALAGRIVNPRKALLDQTTACAAAGESGLELGQGRHGYRGSHYDRIRPAPTRSARPGQRIWPAFRGVEMAMSMTYQSLREP